MLIITLVQTNSQMHRDKPLRSLLMNEHVVKVCVCVCWIVCVSICIPWTVHADAKWTQLEKLTIGYIKHKMCPFDKYEQPKVHVSGFGLCCFTLENPQARWGKHRWGGESVEERERYTYIEISRTVKTILIGHHTERERERERERRERKEKKEREGENIEEWWWNVEMSKKK